MKNISIKRLIFSNEGAIRFSCQRILTRKINTWMKPEEISFGVNIKRRRLLSFQSGKITHAESWRRHSSGTGSYKSDFSITIPHGWGKSSCSHTTVGIRVGEVFKRAHCYSSLFVKLQSHKVLIASGIALTKSMYPLSHGKGTVLSPLIRGRRILPPV